MARPKKVTLPSKKEMVYGAIEERLKKGQKFEETSNKELTADILKKYGHEINYKTLCAHKYNFREDFPKYKTMHKPQKEVIPFKRREKQIPKQHTFKEVDDIEMAKLTASNMLTYAGAVFRVGDREEFISYKPRN